MLRDQIADGRYWRAAPGLLKEIVEDLPQIDANRAREGADHEKVEQGGGRRESFGEVPKDRRRRYVQVAAG